MRKIREELSPEKLDAVRQSGKDVKKHIIDTRKYYVSLARKLKYYEKVLITLQYMFMAKI